ncbi:MAG TPA: RNA polymerase sigma factor, partial [Opitutaceae bacterium]|nr:RNA polymerase sigma factor [Opitutaceae bacterium]
ECVDLDLPLIQALQAGDDSALNELINRHRESLFRFVFRFVRDETVARDVVQETFVRVYFNAKKFEPRSLVKTWLYAIALNLARDQGRKLAKRRREISLNAPGPDDGPALELADDGPTPGELAGRRDRFGALQRAIDQLPHKLKAALILFSLEGRSQSEAADILGTTPKTIETRVYHAKEKLRRLLDPNA